MTQPKWKIILFCFLTGIFFFQCRRDKAIVPGALDCVELPPSTNMLGYQYQQPQLSYNSPCYNPIDSNEIIYIRGDFTNNTTELRKYNLQTKMGMSLATNIWGHPSWGSNGWILFNHADNQVWKIKSNGDSLTQLTTQGGIDAIWNGSGNKIAYWIQNGPTYTFITDKNGTISDTLLYPCSMYRGSWSPDDSKIATSCGNRIGYIDVNSKQIYCLPSDGSISSNGVAWLPDSKTMIWCGNIYKGVLKSNIANNSTVELRSICSSRSYLFPTVSPNGKRIIVQRSDSKFIGNNTVWIEGNLFIMNIDGSNEVKLEVH